MSVTPVVSASNRPALEWRFSDSSRFVQKRGPSPSPTCPMRYFGGMNPYDPSRNPDDDSRESSSKFRSYEWMLFGGLASVVSGVLLATVVAASAPVALPMGAFLFFLGLIAVTLSLR